MPAHISRALTATLLLALLILPATGQAQTEPVQFTISGTVTDAGDAPIDHAQLIVTVEGTTQVLADRIFTQGDGTFSATFQAEVVPNVGLDDPLPPGVPHFSGFWMGQARPNPVVPGGANGLTLPFAAPSSIGAPPELQMFDARGRRIELGEQMASGVYFYRLNFEGRVTDARKLVVLGTTKIQPELRRVAGPRTIDQPGASGDDLRRAEGEAFVEITVLKPGFVGTVTPRTLDSRVVNNFDAELSLAPLPTAALSISGDLTQGEAVLYDGLGSTAPGNPALKYSWDFGDGERGGGQLVAHVYSEPGTYTVELTVSTVHGATATSSEEITISAVAPPVTTDAASVGTVRDALGNLLGGVTVSLVNGAASGQTDAQGVVTLTGLPTGVPMALLCEKPGYTRQVIRMILPANTTDSEFRATLRKQRGAIEVTKIEDGTDHTGEHGVRLDLPAESLVKPDGTPATGSVELRMTPVDVADPIESGAFPGAYEGVLTDGQRGLIVSYGVAEFVIEQNGEELQLAPGSTATIDIPIFTPGAAVDDVVALWSVDETTGLWVEEGAGTVVASATSPTGLALRAEVTHFSWWNCDAFLGAPYRPIPMCKIKDEDGLPTLQLPPGESCYLEGKMLSPNGPTSRPTINLPPEGGLPLLLPPDVDVQLDASSANGTKKATVVVNGSSGVEEMIIIGLDDPAGTPGMLDLPADFDAAIDPAGEVDTYTFDASIGQYFNVFASRATGSDLEGELRVFAPDDSELFSGAFANNGVSFGHEALATGTYRIEIDGTANEPGGYHLSVQFAEIHDVALGGRVDGDFLPGGSVVLNFPVNAGEWFSVNYMRRETVGFGLAGELTVLSPSETEVYDIYFGTHSVDTGLIQATETGTYRVLLSSRTIEAAYSIFVREVPEIPIGGIASGEAEERSVRYWRFNAPAGSFLRTSVDNVVNFVGSSSLVTGENGWINGSLNYQVSNGSQLTGFDVAGDYFVKLESSFNTIRTTRSFRVSLNNILPPETLTFDAAGRATINGGQIGSFGDVRLYEFTASAASGALATLTGGDVSSLGIGTDVGFVRVGSGDWRNPESTVFGGLDLFNSGNADSGLLEQRGVILDTDDTYILYLTAPTPQDGEYDLTVDTLAPSATIVVDNDLLDCPDADTRSILLAGLVAPAGATINVCAGTYDLETTMPLNSPGVSLVGSSAAEVNLRMLVRNYLIYAQEAPARIANLTLTNMVSTNSLAIYLSSSANAILEDLVIDPAAGSLPTGIELRGNSDSGAIVRRCVFNNCERAIEGRTNDVLIEDCDFDGDFQLVEFTGSGITVQDNVWNADRVGTVLDIGGGAGHQVLNNQITILTPDIGATLKSPAVAVEDDDRYNDRPETVVRGNSITTNEVGFDLQLGRTGSEVLCEQNLVNMTGRGQTALVLLPRYDQAPTARIRNNVFNGVSYFEGIHLRWAEWYGSVELLNNTLRVDDTGIVQPTYATVLVDLYYNSPFTGALPILMANNVIQGPGAGTAVTVPANCTIDADYNLLNQFATWYGTGATSTGTNDLLGVDPLFEAGILLELQAGSPAVDSGAGVGTLPGVPPVDYDGTSRPQGGGTDRGAHER